MALDSKDQNESVVSSAAEEAQKAAGATAESLKSQARDFAEQQKKAAAEQIGGVADAMHDAADDLHGKTPMAAEYVEQVAARLDAAASTLREHKVDDMVGTIADFARKQPAMFFAGAVATGFAMSRFLKSSAEKG